MSHKFYVIMEIDNRGPLQDWAESELASLLTALTNYTRKVRGHDVTFFTYKALKAMEWVNDTETSIIILTTGVLPMAGTPNPQWHSGWWISDRKLGYGQYQDLRWYERVKLTLFADPTKFFGQIVGRNLSHEITGHAMSHFLGVPDLTHNYQSEHYWYTMDGQETTEDADDAVFRFQKVV